MLAGFVGDVRDGPGLAIDFAAVADAKNQSEQLFVFDLVDEPVIANAVFPKLAELRTVQGLSDAARVVQWGDAFVKELQDALALLRSSLLSSRSTWADSSICQAMPLQCIFEWNGLLLPAADTFEGAFGSVEVFEIVQVLEDGLADIEGLRAASAPGQFFEAFFDGWWKPDGQHGNLAI